MPRFYIVEDDPAVGDSLALYLASLGHSAVRYSDAESFFSEVVPEAGDTLIVDIGLPGMSGSQLIRWASRLREEPVIIVISGESERSLRSKLEGLPVKKLIRKPFDLSAVESLL